ncbi:MAG TPA: DUF2723 domain-containing protein [Ignavibacteria bacterium]|nr:DUF2723 domain-containing protein [Ignavibacteria bacterium]
MKKLTYIYGIAAGIIAFAVYIMTLAPTVWFIDSGELAAVATTLGIAHPTGYPLFTIIGHIFTLLPIGTSEIYRLNLMSAFFCSLGVFMFFMLVRFFMQQGSITEDKPAAKQPKSKVTKSPAAAIKEKVTAIPDIIVYTVSGFAALVLAFSKTYWAAANSVEVYPLHVFFLSTLMFVFMKAVFSTKRNETESSFITQNKYYLIFAFLLGLSFTNHLTTILLAPACLTLFFYTNVYDKQRLYKLLGFMAVCFVLGFSVYLYLPIRANMNPTLIWGNPYNFERFYWHITGKQFSVWIFSAKGSIPAFLLLMGTTVGLAVYGLVKQKTLNKSLHFIFFSVVCVLGYLLISGSSEIVNTQFKKFSASLWGEFGTALVLLSILGIYFLSRFNTRIYYFTFLTFFGCLFYSINYDINDIYSYFLLAYITLAVWIGFGAVFIYTQLAVMLKTNIQRLAFGIVVALTSLIALNTNYAGNDESKNHFVEEFTMNVFQNAEPNSIIISSQWDFWVSASWYFHFVKNIRPDIVVIDKELLRRSWYFKFLENNYPEVYNNSRAEIERFLPELYKFEHDIPYDTRNIMKLFEEMMTSFVKNNPNRRSYITWEIEQNKNEPFAQDFIRLPDGLLFRMVPKDQLKNNQVTDYKVYDFKFTPAAPKDYYYETLMRSYAMMLTASASYLVTAGRIEDAKKYITLSLAAVPNFPLALELKKKYSL